MSWLNTIHEVGFPYVDRPACAWLIKRFIDPEVEFIFINWLKRN